MSTSLLWTYCCWPWAQRASRPELCLSGRSSDSSSGSSRSSSSSAFPSSKAAGSQRLSLPYALQARSSRCSPIQSWNSCVQTRRRPLDSLVHETGHCLCLARRRRLDSARPVADSPTMDCWRVDSANRRCCSSLCSCSSADSKRRRARTLLLGFSPCSWPLAAACSTMRCTSSRGRRLPR